MPSRPICDLCSQPSVRWCYPARDFIDVGIVGPDRILISESISGWAACDECHRLIEAGNREVLLKRSIRNFVALYGVLPPTLADDVRRIHDRFFAHRCGPALEVATLSCSER
jgi:hypothetical protein